MKFVTTEKLTVMIVPKNKREITLKVSISVYDYMCNLLENSAGSEESIELGLCLGLDLGDCKYYEFIA